MIASLSSLFPKIFPGAWCSAASALANHLWQSTLFAAIAAVLALALRNNRAHVRYWLWFTASAKFLFPFSLLIVLGTQLASLHPTAKPIAAANANTYFVMQEVSQPFDLATLPPPPSAPAPSPITRLRASLGGSFLPPALAAIWLAGFLFILSRWWLRWYKIARIVRIAPALTAGREADTLLCMQQLAGLKRSISLKSLPIAIEPGIFGIFRPVLLWPEGISSHLDDAQLASVIAHEVCHVRRRDNLTAALHMAVEAIFWFHPLVWWLETRLIAERETACDQDVPALCGPTSIYARAYAESILKVCEFSIESPLPCIAGVTGADLRRRIAAIVTGRALASISWPKISLLAIAAACAVAAPLVFGMVKMVPLYGQILHSDGPLPSFEVATIRPTETSGFPAPPGIDRSKIVHAQEVRITSAPPFSDQVERIMTAKMLIADAYRLPAFSKAQLVGGPDWADQTMYRIKAKIGEEQYAAMLKMPSAQQQQQVRLMEESLLADRFRLRVRFETRELPVYALQIAKGGPKLTPAKIESVPAESVVGAPQTQPSVMNMTGTGDGFKIQGKNISAAQLILLLQQQPELGNRLMVDQTGLNAKYDLTLNWTRDLTAAADAAPAPTDAPSLFTALNDQLGLELVETKAPIEVIVIDHIEKPSIDGAEVPQNTAPAQIVHTSVLQDKPAQGTTILPKFDVISVKPPDPKENIVGLFTYPGGMVRCTLCPLQYLIMEAFEVQPHQIWGGPDWVDKSRFDIEAKPPADSESFQLNPAYAKVPPNDEQRKMLQSLLMDRFQLRFHRTVSQDEGYILVRNDKPLMLQPPKDPNEYTWAGSARGGSFGHGIAGNNITMAQFALRLSGALGHPVADQTGISGAYDFKYEDPSDDSTPGDMSSVFRSLQKIGLTLKSVKAPVETIVIDHVELPSPN